MERPQLTIFHSVILILIVLTGLHKANADTLKPHRAKSAPTYIQPAAPNIASTAHITIDVNSGKILAQKGIEEKRPPASLTKVMTVYVVASALKSGQIKLEDKVTISKKAWKTPGSKMFVKHGQRVSIQDLLQGIIVDSGNDACVALAEYLAGNEKNFTVLMNKQAKALGMNDTNFTDSTGLPHKDLYTTAKDLAILSRAIIKDFPEYYHWFKQKWFTFNGIKQPNRNRLLWRNALVDGMKTGHTDQAGYALIASAKKGDMRLVSVILGAPSESARADGGQRLLSYGFRFFETHKFYAANKPITSVRVWKGTNNKAELAINHPLYLTIPSGSYNDLEISTHLNQHIEAPIKQGQELGKLTIKLNNKLLAEVPLHALANIERGNLLSRMKDGISLSFKKLMS